MARKFKSTASRPERVYLVGADVRGKRSLWTMQDSLAELGELARSAGASVVGSSAQRLARTSQAYLGKGKLDEIRRMADDAKFDTVICDDELVPSQQRNFEQALNGAARVIDRTALILDVFARRAQTREGRLQVELAQYEYLLPRLAGQWTHLERQRGGIGMRGPGETQIETDRRLVRNRIARIKKDLDAVRRHRSQYRMRRKSGDIPVISLVGYTNAGKSTLLNSLAKAGVAAEDRLFSTLDPVTRKIRLPSGGGILMTDTVGFIQKLPPAVVSAFRATLEEAQESALLLHVVDIAHPNATAQAQVVEQVLDDLDLLDKPRILVLNKTDLLEGSTSEIRPGWSPRSRPIGQRESPQGRANEFTEERPGVVLTSAMTGRGLDDLLDEIETHVSANVGAAEPHAMSA